MSKDAPAPAWRNFAVWSAVGAPFSVIALVGATSLVLGDGIGELASAVARSRTMAATLALALIFSIAVAGFAGARRPVTPRTLRNFVIRDAVVIGAFMLVVWGFGRLTGTAEMSASLWAATVMGATILVVACLGGLAVASAQAGAGLIDDEVALEEMRERGRLLLSSFAWMIACGALMIVLGLAGAGALSPPAALAIALLLIAILLVLGIVSWRLSDELDRTLCYETGNLAFYLILVLGGGWAMLAHLGFAAEPAPLDWVTLFVGLLFVASFIVLGRRKLLRR